MPSSLSDEHYIVIPSSLAATVGLEEAALLQLLADMRRFSPASANVMTIVLEQLLALTPFWDAEKLKSVLASLSAKGVIEATFSGNNVLIAETAPAIPTSAKTRSSAPSTAARELLSTAEKTPVQAAVQAQNKAPAQTTRQSTRQATEPTASARTAISPMPQRASAVKPMSQDWQPRPSTYDALLHNHGVSKAFAETLLDEFRIYWQDKGTTAFSWDSKFLRHVMHAQRNQQAKTAVVAQAAEAAEIATQADIAIDSQWQPSADCLEILLRDGVSQDFINTTVPEFILYWRERGDSQRTWNSKFIAHVRRQWLRFNSAQVHDTEPHRIPSNWQPKQDTFDIIEMANIPKDFASAQVGGFVLFWRESNQLHKSWNAKFLQHVKYQWAKQNQINANEITHQSATGKDPRSFVEKHSDTSWADDL